MPGRNILKINAPNFYYHVYARGVNKQSIFNDEQDYSVFLNLLKRYLSLEPSKDPYGRLYPHYRSQVKLLCYCLMSNHFHLLVYQHQQDAMALLMKGVMTSYSQYFNKKYSRRGPLFESRYRAAQINRQEYLEHITRYIHLNPEGWKTYPFSSIHSYLQKRHEEWLEPDDILAIFEDNSVDYETFVEDYESHKAILDEIQSELADTT